MASGSVWMRGGRKWVLGSGNERRFYVVGDWCDNTINDRKVHTSKKGEQATCWVMMNTKKSREGEMEHIGLFEQL